MTDSHPYRVLARKYRPQRFGELIGQDAMVQTLGNAIARDRLAHAFLLTGVRGVGKTSTARLIAKALNCIGPDGRGGPTIDPCGICEPCVAIAEGRHIDVVEMDAASHTGIDDVREIIEAVRYAAVSARYKVYIIDEVHMLSKQAFNGLLKTLEEPPAHVKFLFATTEVAKVPVTVLSRCQRFDLRRIPAERLAAHFAWVCGEEQVEAEPEALALIARAAEGSVRDGLSILDQAIAMADGKVSAVQLRTMLGLSDRGATRALFGLMLAGDASGALAALADQRDLGTEENAVLRALLELVHGITRRKLARVDDAAMSAEEREALDGWAERLSFPQLHRLWQLLLKGLEEVQTAPSPGEAAEMALLRIIHAAELPDPGELARRLAGMAEATVSTPVAAAPPAPEAPSPPAGPKDLPGLIDALTREGRFQMAQQLHDLVGLVACAPPELILKPLAPFPAEFARELGAALKAATGEHWQVQLSDGPAQPSLRETEEAAAKAARDEILADPLVRAATEGFPEAELIEYGAREGR